MPDYERQHPVHSVFVARRRAIRPGGRFGFHPYPYAKVMPRFAVQTDAIRIVPCSSIGRASDC